MQSTSTLQDHHDYVEAGAARAGVDPVDPAEILPEGIRPYVAVPALNPMQVGAIPLVLEGDRNVVVAAPTGSGKTLVAEVALLRECRERGRAGVYLAPMRAIAAEKRDDWQRLEGLGLRVYKTTGEDDAFDEARALAADIIVSTPEKWDSIGRRALAPALVARIGAIVMDEVHLVDEGQRGAGQEAMLARIPRLFPGARIVAMSGTLANAGAIARWLDAALYESRWRPIALTKRIVPYRPVGQWEQDEEARTRIAATIARDVVAAEGATLVFCGSRKGVERCALALARSLGLSAPARQHSVGSAPLRQALAGGVAFHHAGLAREDRSAAEQAFRSGGVKVLVATSTVAAGVNLPARAVVVRDLQLGTSDLSASGLLQMAGRAGRPGLETEGYCYVVAPEKDVDRVKGMLGGSPVGSRLGDDLATHINTEIALGLVTSRADVAAWYARTLHRHVAPRPADLDKPLRFLIDEGFVTKEGEALRPTALGKATSDLMIRVASATALERYIAAEHKGTADPNTLEEEILVAACGLPVELDELSDRGFDDTLRRALGGHDERVREWAQGRVEYLAVAACLLCGLAVEGLPIENPLSVRASVTRELPRYLRFLVRRADERTPGAPDLMVAAADLATALEYGVADRGAGGLLDLLRRTLPAGGGRQYRVAERYAGLRGAGVGSLKDALPYVDPGGALAAARPRGAPRLDTSDGRLVARVDYRGRPVRAHARVAGQGAAVCSSVRSGDLREMPLAPLRLLGDAGPRDVSVELVVGGPTGYNGWVYARSSATVQVPESTIDYAAIDRILRAGGADDADDADGADDAGAPATATAAGKRTAPALRAEHRMAQGEYRRLVADAPGGIARAAAAIAGQAPRDRDKIEAVMRVVRRRALAPQAREPRSLHDIMQDDALGSKDATELAVALLWALDIPARTLPATLDNALAWAPAVLQGDHWYWLPVWPDRQFEVYHSHVDRWPGKEGQGQETTIGWEVVARYRSIARRTLPLAVAATTPPADDRAAAGRQDGPSCPTCKGPMRLRANKSAGSEFWGCARYPACKGTRPA